MSTTLAVSCLASAVLAVLYVYTQIKLSRLQRFHLEEQTRMQGEYNTLQTKFQYQSRDPVSRLPGWQIFEDRVNQGIKECARYHFLMGVLYIDIDNFKLINNAMGYEAGNALLLEAAERLQLCIRQVDSITRQGKDTFVVMLAQLARQETAAIIVQRMLNSLAEPFIINGNTINITACIGGSFYPNDGLTTGELMQNAEYAMLIAKGCGKQHYEFYQKDVQADCQRELGLYNGLSSENFLEELVLTYQPVMNVGMKSLYFVDTQVKWKHPIYGLIAADELFIYADKQRKLNKITERLLIEGIKKFKHWQMIGLNPPLLGIPVMLKQLENTQFIYSLSQILQEQKMEPGSVVLELLDCAAPVSLDILEKSFNMLKYLGVKIAIDRYGSGAFSLRYFKIFSVNFLKLDPLLISDIEQNEQTRMIVKAIAAFASAMSLEVIAEGVESKEQSQLLLDAGISLQQGQLLGESLSEPVMTKI